MINNIQLLRGFAAINVVVFHIIGAASTYHMDVVFFQFLKGWGANGVDIFFVISGFIMLYTEINNRKPVGIFLKNRLIRVVPLYWMATFFIILINFVLPTVFKSMTITPDWAIASLFFTSSLVVSKDPVIFVGWTLELEMLFYVVFSIGLLIKSWKYAILFISCFLIMISWVTGDLIIIEFIFGMLAAHIFVNYHIPRGIGIFLLIFGAAFLLASLFPWVYEINLNRVILWGVPSFLLVLGAVSINLPNFRVFSYLGDASYSIYLIQVFTIPGFYKFAGFIFKGWDVDLISFICLILSLSFSCLVYSYLERPVLMYLRKILNV